jgi:GDP-4-dehydro-6-deoxy-D-mannose reductase
VRVLVTGGNGFVGGYLVAALREGGDDVVSAGRLSTSAHRSLELRDAENVRRLVDEVRPELIFHLAAQAFVPEALASPLDTYDVNVMGTARLIDAVRNSRGAGNARIIFASSGEVYGVGHASRVAESLPSRPVNPYGASKAAAESLVLGSTYAYGLDAVIYRGFNQIGPGQDERFVAPSFAKQLAKIADGAEPVLLVGNLDAQRDFLDVRDAVAACLLLAQRGERGQIYNVCRGEGVVISEILRALIRISGLSVEVREDPQRMRASDNPISVGDPTKLSDRTGWRPQYSLDATLRDVYEDARRRTAAVR